MNPGHEDCRRKPCPYCRSIVIADDGPDTDDTYVERQGE